MRNGFLEVIITSAKKERKFLYLFQALLVIVVPWLIHRGRLVGVDYYFYKAQKPWSGGSTYPQECFLQGWLAWICRAGKSLESFQFFNLALCYIWILLLIYFLNKRTKTFNDYRQWFIPGLVTLVMITHTAMISLSTTLGFPDPLTAIFGLCLIFLNSPVALFISAILGMLSHPTQFLFAGISMIMLRNATGDKIIWRDPIARSILSGLVLGKFLVWSLLKITHSVTSEQRLQWVTDRNFWYWWNLNIKTMHEYIGLHGNFWALAIILIFISFKLSKKVGLAYSISLGLGLLTTFISEDRPRIFISIAVPGFIFTLSYCLVHPKIQSYLKWIIFFSLSGVLLHLAKFF